jgi:hypothetical protein
MFSYSDDNLLALQRPFALASLACAATVAPGDIAGAAAAAAVVWCCLLLLLLPPMMELPVLLLSVVLLASLLLRSECMPLTLLHDAI